MGGWGCPHEVNGKCHHLNGVDCDPGMKGCVLYGRFRFSTEDKNSPRIRREMEPRRDASGRRGK
jgi:hypothetical protein